MATINFKGICSGTVQKVSRSKGTTYNVTSFVEIPSLNKFEVFGDLGLLPHEEPRDYVLNGNVVNLGNVSVVAPASAPSKKS